MGTTEVWETKYPKFAAEMASRKYKNVTEVLKAKPDVKFEECSKQYVRDALREMVFDPVKDKAAPKPSEDQVVECAYRYISIYDTITGSRFEFPAKVEPARRIISSLQRAGMIAYGASSSTPT